MFIEKIIEENQGLVEVGFQFHQKGIILPDSYLVDMDALKENARKIYEEASKQGIDVYFMLKQVGRNPYIAKELVKIGYKGAVVVDFKEAQLMMKYHIPIMNIGHLVQTPKAFLKQAIDYDCEYYTVFTLEKIKDLNECARQANKKIKIILKVVGENDFIYSGQTAGFRLENLKEEISKIKNLSHVEIDGVTSFPCFLYNEEKERIMPTPNFHTLMKAKKILGECGIEINNVNAPSASSIASIQEMKGYHVDSIEPGHGLTGTTPMHAHMKCAEKPAVIYISEISHNFDGHAYCYGGGHYRRGHVKNGLVGKSFINSKKIHIIPPSADSIDYYFEIDEECDVNDTVLMSFRFQVFVTRSNVCLIEGISKNNPVLIGTWTSLGDEIYVR